jgi:D-amino-acid dehydrogenase
MGHRPTLCDFRPVLGRAPGVDNVFLAFGHHHLGLTLSAVTGEIMGALIAGDEVPIDLAPFALERF